MRSPTQYLIEAARYLFIFLFGSLLTAVSYAMARPGGLYAVAGGAIVVGAVGTVVHLIAALVAALRRREGEIP